LDATFDYPIEILRYSLPWVRVAIAIDDNIGLAIAYLSWESIWPCSTGTALRNRQVSDWPEFAHTLKSLPACARYSSNFYSMADSWTISDCEPKGDYARVYERLDRVAVVVAETEARPDGRPLNSMRLATASTRLLRIANLLTFRVNRGRSAPSAAELGS